MFLLPIAFTYLFVAAFGAMPAGAPCDPKISVQSGVVFEGMLVCLSSDGTIDAWDLKTEKYVKDTAARFTRKGLIALAVDGDKLWATDEKMVYSWSAKKREWEKYNGFDPEDEKLLSLTSARGRPLLVFRSKIIDPTREKDGTFKFPKDIDGFPGTRWNVSATYRTDKMLWVGTDNGEWGGKLIGFEPEGGKWIKSWAWSGVTAITAGGTDEIVVSCYTAHLRRKTRIQVFKPDATEKISHPAINDRCYYCLAYNSHDKTLYGMERRELVTIKDGKPTTVAEVASGVLALIPLGPKALVVVADEGAPYLLRDGKLVRLPAP